MFKRIPILLCCLLVVSLSFYCRAETEASKVTYYWVAKNEVLLWRGGDDDQPISATLDEQTQQWKIEPKEKTELWRPFLKQIVLSYVTNGDLERISDEELWAFTLVKLHNEYDHIRWARPHRTSVEVYLLLQDASHATVAFLYGNAENPMRATAHFTQSLNGLWSKASAENLDLKELLKVPDDPNELSSVFGLNIPEAKSKTVQWANVWDSWIKDFVNGPPVRHFGYRDSQGQLRFTWQERLTGGVDLPARYHVMTTSPLKIAEPKLATIGAPVEPSAPWWLILLVPALLLLGLALFALRIKYIVAAFIDVGRTLRRKLTGAKTLSPDIQRGTDTSSAPVAISEDTLNAIHNRALERWQSISVDPAAHEVLKASLELARQEYLASAASQDLLSDLNSYRTAIIDEYRFEALKVPPDVDDSKIKRWIKLGQAAEEASAQFSDLKLPHEVKVEMGGQHVVQGWSECDLAAEWPRLVNAFKDCLGQATEQRDEFKRHLEESESNKAKAIAEKEREAQAKWQTRVSELEAMNKTHVKQRAEDLLALEHEKGKVEGLRLEGSKLRTELGVVRSEKSTAQVTGYALQKKIEELNHLKWLSRALRIWLQGYSEGRINDDRKSREVAVLSALINFSICQMCFSIIDDLPELRQGIAHNIKVFTQMFDQRYGQGSDFEQARDLLLKIAPQFEFAKPDEKQMGGDTLDDPLFRGLLYWLKTDTGKNLSPFFIDMDSKRSTLAFVTTS
jgi:hypothetical protein